MVTPLPAVISEPDVGPSLRKMTLLPERLAFVRRIISPDVLFVLSLASIMRKVISPEPAFRDLVAARTISALPLSRCASITPLAAVSLAIIVIKPPLVVMLSLMLTERPARKVSPPADCAKPPTCTALLTVISLEACKVKSVPLANISATS